MKQQNIQIVKFCDLPIPETEYQKDINEVYTSPIELWLRHLTEENINLDYVEKSSMEQYDSFNIFYENGLKI